MILSYQLSNEDVWNDIVASLPGGHVLQSKEWAQVKSHFGWQYSMYYWNTIGGEIVAAALVLRRSIALPGFRERLGVVYIPKGPLLDWEHRENRMQVLLDLEQIARQHSAIFVKIDPDVIASRDVHGSQDYQVDPVGEAVMQDLKGRGWRYSDEQIQFQNTVLIDLSAGEETLLSNMKQKTRYNVRLAERRGVKVRRGQREDLPDLFRMYAETSLRDGFVIREEDYYLTVWNTFMHSGLAQPLIAEVEGQMVAAVIVFHFAGVAWYFYGMSSLDHREKMPNYLLQWEAMRYAKANNCRMYDLWGAPDVFSETDPMWGVYRFKRGLGGKVVSHIGAWDLPIRRGVYRLYTQILPKVLDYMRWRGTNRTEQTFGG